MRRHIGQTIRPRNFRARSEWIEEHYSKVKKGKTSAKKGEWENAFSGKQMDSVQEETLAVSATEIIVNSQHNRPSLLQRRKHRLTEEDFPKGMPLGGAVHPEKRSKSVQKIHERELRESVV